uniref:AB hydrolase-1 domain-containing protein n=1 Tax=Globisporangium ultimum (strain ATCC 200006 / CBS 805.95 / DAOM BR144) TaxID=431595 RepID=K3XCE8_GLOUD
MTASEWTRWEHKFAQVQDDIQLHYVDVGPRDGTPLVLVHGWPDLWFGWRYQIGPLSKRYRVIAPDLRGFGRSSTPKDVSKYGGKNITSDLARLLDILEIPKAVFIGHDWGGSIAWRMCLYHPDRVLAVCSICTPYLPPTPQLVDIDAFVAAAPQFAYMKLLSQTETTAPLFDQAPRRLFTVMFKHHYELENMFVVDVFKNVVNSDSPLYTVRSDLLTEEELDYYED